LSLNTLHSSKGLQFDVVIIPGLEEGRLPSWSARSDHALREARRTFYVGFTRARYLVYILFSGWYENLRGVFENGPSRFVIELENALS
jgi:DNA helicase-2/ATP-dependent DNA helicase PcrA